jgi:hypothetical protein
MKEHDIKFHEWLNETDKDSVTRFKRCTGYLDDTEKKLSYELLRLGFMAGFARGRGLIGGSGATTSVS